MSRNNVSSYECSGTPVPQINRPLWHNVPWLIHCSHFDHIYELYHAYNDRCIKLAFCLLYGNNDDVLKWIALIKRKTAKPIWFTKTVREVILTNLIDKKWDANNKLHHCPAMSTFPREILLYRLEPELCLLKYDFSFRSDKKADHQYPMPIRIDYINSQPPIHLAGHYL